MRSVLLLSGGMDSAVLLWKLRQEGHEVHTLGVDYGQRHRREILAAKKLAKLADADFKVIDLTALQSFLAGSALTSPEVEVPKGHYTDESMKSTVVPNRNMLLLSVATSFAISLKANLVAYAAHGGDHVIYPDCRPKFVEALGQAIAICDWHSVKLHTPFLRMTKAEICSLGISMEVPFAETWSCYVGGEKHCGKCGTCVERREAFQVAGVDDPTEYEDESNLEDRIG